MPQMHRNHSGAAQISTNLRIGCQSEALLCHPRAERHPHRRWGAGARDLRLSFACPRIETSRMPTLQKVCAIESILAGFR